MRRFTAVLRNSEGEIAAAKLKSDGRIRYGGAWVSAASSLPLRRPITGLIGAAVRRPRDVAALIVLLLKTPPEYVLLSGSSAGRALEAYFNQRSLGALPRTRFCRGVLLLPQDHADYLRGRRRQALRTNLRRAGAAGIRCEVVSDWRRAIDDTRHVWGLQCGSWTDSELHARLEEVRTGLARSEVTVAVARDEDGWPLAMAAVVIDDVVCLIKYAVATSHEARWALHDHLVRTLISRRVRCLLADGGGPFGALGFASNVQHYQHLLGYELRHIIPAGTRRTMPRRRLVGSLALVAATVAAAVPKFSASPTDQSSHR